MTDMKLTGQVAGHEFAGRENIVLTEIALECSVQFF